MNLRRRLLRGKPGFWLLAGALTALCLLLSERIPFLYAVNDDLFMKNIVSGAYLGVPDAHTVYLEYPLSAFLAALYRLAPAFPWYGAVFFSFHMLGWSAAIWRVCRGVTAASSGGGKAWALLFGVLLFFSCGFYHVASLQFTVTAAVLGMAGLVWFQTGDPTLPAAAYLRDQAVTVLFVFLSFNVRRNVLLMLVPIAGMLWLAQAAAVWKSGGRALRRLAELFGVAALSAACVAAVWLCYRAAYGNAAWRDYLRYNDNATVLYDYYGWPDYEENRGLYEELGISREAWAGAREAYLLSVDSGITSEAMERLAQRALELHGAQENVPGRLLFSLKEIGTRFFAETDRPLNAIVLGLYGLNVLLLLLRLPEGVDARRAFSDGRTRRACPRRLVTLLALLTGRMAAWLYVVYAGRYPMRISQSLLLAEAGVLFAALFAGEDAAAPAPAVLSASGTAPGNAAASAHAVLSASGTAPGNASAPAPAVLSASGTAPGNAAASASAVLSAPGTVPGNAAASAPAALPAPSTAPGNASASAPAVLSASGTAPENASAPAPALQAAADPAFSPRGQTAASRGRRRIAAAAFVCAALVLAAACRARLLHVSRENRLRMEESQDLRDLQAYCRDNPDWFYFVDTRSISSDTEGIFDPRGSRPEAYLVFGGWLSDSPVFARKLEQNGVADVEAALLGGRARVVAKREPDGDLGYLERYLASRYPGVLLEQTDAFGRDGGRFLVYACVRRGGR